MYMSRCALVVFGVRGVAFTVIFCVPIIFVSSPVSVLLVKAVPRLQTRGWTLAQVMVTAASPAFHISPELLSFVLYCIGSVTVAGRATGSRAACVRSRGEKRTVGLMMIFWSMVTNVFVFSELCLEKLVGYLGDIDL
jgi:hypothetical protein